MESLLSREPFHAAGEQQFSVTEGALQAGDEFTAKDAAQYLYRQEEGIARVDPALVIGRQTARWDHAVDMRMDLKILPPCVQDAEEADLGAEMFRISGDFH